MHNAFTKRIILKNNHFCDDVLAFKTLFLHLQQFVFPVLFPILPILF